MSTHRIVEPKMLLAATSALDRYENCSSQEVEEVLARWKRMIERVRELTAGSVPTGRFPQLAHPRSRVIASESQPSSILERQWARALGQRDAELVRCSASPGLANPCESVSSTGQKHR